MNEITFIRLDHIMITIPEDQKDQARDFYGNTLGLKEIPGEHPRGSMWFQLGDLELHVREETGISYSSRHAAFEVADLNAAKDFLTSKNIELSYSSEIEGRARCFFRDPFSNRFELIQYIASPIISAL